MHVMVLPANSGALASITMPLSDVGSTWKMGVPPSLKLKFTLKFPPVAYRIWSCPTQASSPVA